MGDFVGYFVFFIEFGDCGEFDFVGLVINFLEVGLVGFKG